MINAIGILAVGNGGSGPPPEPPGPGLKLLFQYGSSGFTGIVDEGDIPAVCPSFDVYDLVCDKIYQRYRVLDGLDERTDIAILAIEGEYALCASNTVPQAFILPYNADDTLKLETAWVTDSTLVLGTTVDAIELDGFNSQLITVVGSGKFIVHPKFDIGAYGDTMAIPIVTYTSPTSFSVVDINVDLDALGLPDNFITGSSGSALNYATGETCIEIEFLSNDSATSGTAILTVDTDTGDITDTLINYSYTTPLAGLTAISASCFENVVYSYSYSAGDYGSYNNVLAGRRSSNYNNISKITFDSRGLYTPEDSTSIFTNYVNPTYASPLSMATAIQDRLAYLGYTVSGSIELSSISRSPCVIPIPTL